MSGGSAVCRQAFAVALIVDNDIATNIKCLRTLGEIIQVLHFSSTYIIVPTNPETLEEIKAKAWVKDVRSVGRVNSKVGIKFDVIHDD